MRIWLVNALGFTGAYNVVGSLLGLGPPDWQGGLMLLFVALLIFIWKGQ